MASSPLLLLLLASLVQASTAIEINSTFVNASVPLKYHNGAVLQGDIPVYVVWYGDFPPATKSAIYDFLASLSPASSEQNTSPPSVAHWWNTVNRLYLTKAGNKAEGKIVVAGKVSDDKCSLGKSLDMSQMPKVAAKASPKKGGVAVVLTAKDVHVQGFCMGRCGMHGGKKGSGTVYVWVGNSEEQCPTRCAWPYSYFEFRPETPPLVAPNGNGSVDGMVMNLATMLAGAVTNPFGDGFFQGSKEAPMEAATACYGVFAKGATPGYPGDLLVDPSTNASYNAHGVKGRKFLLPALFDPASSTCSSLV